MPFGHFSTENPWGAPPFDHREMVERGFKDDWSGDYGREAYKRRPAPDLPPELVRSIVESTGVAPRTISMGLPPPPSASLVQGSAEVSAALQRAVDDGCITATGSVTDWDWTKPLFLDSMGPRQKNVDPPGTPSLCPIDVYDGNGEPPPPEMCGKFYNTGWYWKLCQAMYKTGQRRATIKMLDDTVVSGTVKPYAPGRKIWIPDTGQISDVCV